jgi:hypothetical protein
MEEHTPTRWGPFKYFASSTYSQEKDSSLKTRRIAANIAKLPELPRGK